MVILLFLKFFNKIEKLIEDEESFLNQQHFSFDDTMGENQFSIFFF